MHSSSATKSHCTNYCSRTISASHVPKEEVRHVHQEQYLHPSSTSNQTPARHKGKYDGAEKPPASFPQTVYIRCGVFPTVTMDLVQVKPAVRYLPRGLDKLSEVARLVGLAWRKRCRLESRWRRSGSGEGKRGQRGWIFPVPSTFGAEGEEPELSVRLPSGGVGVRRLKTTKVVERKAGERTR